MTRWAAGFLGAIFLSLLTSCGGSDTPAPSSDTSTASFAVARINAAQGVLELPLLQSGNALYVDVRIGFSPDGTFKLLSGRSAETASRPADAVLQPQTALADLQASAATLQLDIRRPHMDASVYEAVTVELENGRWRYPQPLVPATTLTSSDLRANPALFAKDHQLMVISSAPGHAEVFALRLENRNYRFCMDAQDDGADSIALLDAQGAELLSVRAGGPCASYTAEQGLYKVRHTYGGTGSGRTVFMRQRPAEQVPLTQPPSGRPPLKTTDNLKEYWGILATFLDPVTQRVSSDGFLGLAGARPGDGSSPAGYCFANIAAFLTSTALNTSSPLAATHLFDGANFFERINDSAGNPVKIGPAFVCPDGRLRFEWAYQNETALVMALPGATIPDDHPVRVNGFSAARNTFLLQGASGKGGDSVPDSPLGFPFGVEVTTPAFDGGLRPLTPSQVADWLPEYRTVLRYRPDGLPGTTTPAQGQVALFNSRDCSGAAMLVDQYDLPGIIAGGPLGNFDRSLKLGTLTTATVYASKFHRGERQQLERSGCLASGWGTTGWKAASLSIRMETVQIIVSTKACEQCNLAGIDLSRADLSNGKFYGANLNNAHLGNSNLAGADLRYASLQGAQLPNANLDAANLCAANLNAAPSSAGSSNVAANLNGAYLRNAYLYGSNMAGANFSNASFFSTSAGACQSTACGSYQKPACASAFGATLESTRFSNAYLAGVDMGNVAGSAADFNHAVLSGASFRNATLTPDFNGTAVNFGNAFLQGTDFTGANLVSAIFTNAYVDTAPNGGCMQFELGAAYTSFPGFSVPTPPGSATCARAASPAPTCVQFTYNRPTILSALVDPPTTPLSQAIPRNSSCFDAAPLCGDAFTGVGPNTCWSSP
ncbi:pentapeptide repeat-containing protein [Polaromonas hydrogenivorans]|uniref:Pentapeptide repeat-containing protein n=1 Tax=Polaromonas hydrogenivorans TaxID=335476 RepID=A0AAU7LVY9_9BURK